MSIFSKLFGSIKFEDQKVEEVISSTEETSVKEESLPDPQNLPEAMRYVVQKWGTTYLQNRSLLNILNDFQVLKELPAAKHIIRNMQESGYMEKLSAISNWELESKSIASQYTNEFGAKEDITLYVVQCIGYGLHFCDDIPCMKEPEVINEPTFDEPEEQTININPVQNTQTPSGPYDPKLELEFYQYPTLDLLEEHQNAVSIKSVLSSDVYQNTTMELPCAIGMKDNGEVLMFDLANAPHLMISGSSGMGVSVCFNAIITSLLYKKHPAEVKFVMVDPKKIEFAFYSSLEKHFLAAIQDKDPVVTETTDISQTLWGLGKELQKRLDLFKEARVRNIKDYNRGYCDRRLSFDSNHTYLPYIVVFIDEYDILSRKDIETPLEFISKTGKSTGIHLVISVQRPTVDILSASIKTNMPARISFRVTSIHDSRNILGRGGAEKLVYPGELIYTDGINLEKAKGAYMDIGEIDRINDFIRNQQGYLWPYELPDPNEEETSWSNTVDMQHLDPMFEDAARLIVREQCGSTSLIQRKFAIGYNRAGRLMNQLEKAGIVGQAYGSKPRDVLVMDMQSLEKILKAWR